MDDFPEFLQDPGNHPGSGTHSSWSDGMSRVSSPVISKVSGPGLTLGCGGHGGAAGQCMARPLTLQAMRQYRLPGSQLCSGPQGVNTSSDEIK